MEELETPVEPHDYVVIVQDRETLEVYSAIGPMPISEANDALMELRAIKTSAITWLGLSVDHLLIQSIKMTPTPQRNQ